MVVRRLHPADPVHQGFERLGKVVPVDRGDQDGRFGLDHFLVESGDIVLLDKSGELDLDGLMTEVFLLEMDTKNLCSEDCRGLCPGCGVDLNHEPCRCKKEIDPRLAKLAQLLEKQEDQA